MGPIGSIMAWHDRKRERQLVLNSWQDLIEAVPAVHHRSTPHRRAEQLRLTSKAGTHCAFAGIDGDTGSIALEIIRKEYEESRPIGEFRGVRQSGD